VPEPFIRAGEWLTCENGHRYAKAKVDIAHSSPVKSQDFELMDGGQPKSGELIGVCECGAHRTFADATGTVPFVEGRGWLRPRPKE
jgi:hypothetical protein